MLIAQPITINHQELHMLGLRARGQVKSIYLHWTAGNYGQVYSKYHLNIDKKGEVYLTCNELYQKKSHTFMRNSESIGIALCCGAGAYFTSNKPEDINFGKAPPTPFQIEQMAQVVAILADALELPINFNTVKTHAEAAIMDGYGPLSDDEQKRWDLWFLPHYKRKNELRLGGIVLREKANWYSNMFELKKAG